MSAAVALTVLAVVAIVLHLFTARAVAPMARGNEARLLAYGATSSAVSVAVYMAGVEWLGL